MKRVLYIHTEKRIQYGAHYTNDLIIETLRKRGIKVDSVYPTQSLNLIPKDLAGISNILFFYSLITKKKMLSKNRYDIIQGTTYTPLAFLGGGVSIISLFGSTMWGFIKNVPSIEKLKKESLSLKKIYEKLKDVGIIKSIKDLKKPLKDISKIEIYVAKNSDAVIATSKKVREELIKNKVPKDKIHIIYNAIEDYWFKTAINKKVKPVANLVYHGRTGDDPFTIKIKGVNRLIYILYRFPNLNKKVIALCRNIKGYSNIFSNIPKTRFYPSIEKNKIPNILKNHYADLYINPGRYEGFCLSLIEAMSQGLIPIIFPIGVAPEIIKNRYNGYIVYSLEEMDQRIRYLINRARKRRRMAERSIKTAKKFNADRIAQKYERIYEIVKKKKEEENMKKMSKLSGFLKSGFIMKGV